MEAVEVPSVSVFVNHGYVQHVVSEVRDDYCIRYHSYSILKNHDLPDRIAFAYAGSTALRAEKNSLSLSEGPDQQVGA